MSPVVRTCSCGDISGEAFRALRDHPARHEEITALRRTNVLAVVLDGAKLAKPGERNVELGHGRVFARGLLERGAAPYATRLQVVATKWDHVTKAAEQHRVESDLDKLASRLRDYGLPVDVHLTASWDELDSGVEPGLGLDELLATWMAAQFDQTPDAQAGRNRWERSRSFHRFPLEARVPWL